MNDLSNTSSTSATKSIPKGFMAILFVFLLLFSGYALAKPEIVIKTSEGMITIDLNSEKAPETVKNFLTYVELEKYDGTIFHRVIKSFMIQGGGFDKEMNQISTNMHKPIVNESDNGLENKRGTIAMARTSHPHSATNQFFINTVDNDFLNYNDQQSSHGYAVFGEVIDGMDIVDKISNVATEDKLQHQNVPTTNIIIETITVNTSKNSE